MNEREKLAAYQANLLDALHAAESVEQAQAAMLQVAKDAGMADDLGTVDPNMLRIAMQLTRKWGVQKNDSENVER